MKRSRKPIDRVTTFQGDSGKHYWRCIAANGKIVADGAQGYATPSNARRGYRTARMIIARCTHAEES